MDKKSQTFIQGVSLIILDTIASIACHNSQSKERSRGKDFFGKNSSQHPDNEKLGLTYFLLALESVTMWARWFPKEPNTSKMSKFMKKYEEIVEKGVVLPETLTYFKDIVYEAENIEKDFMKIKKVFAEELVQNEQECNQKALLELIKEFSLRLNSEKIIEIIVKLEKEKNFDKNSKIFEEKNMKNFEEKNSKFAEKNSKNFDEKNMKNFDEKNMKNFDEKNMNNFEDENSKFEDKNSKFEEKNSKKFDEKNMKISEEKNEFSLHFELLDQNLKFFKKILMDFEHYHDKSLSYSDFRSEFLEIFSEAHMIQVKHCQALYSMAPEPQAFVLCTEEDDSEILSHLETISKYKKPLGLVKFMFEDFLLLRPLLFSMKYAFSLQRNFELKFKALLLLKHAMDLRNPEFALLVEKDLKNVINSNFSEENTGKFEKNEENFRKLHQECVLIWSIWYPKLSFGLDLEEIYEKNMDFTFFDRISYEGFETNKLSDFCVFHLKIEDSLEIFAFLKQNFLRNLKELEEKHEEIQEYKVENYLLLFEDLCRHQENLHTNETEENVAFFQNTLKKYEIYQKKGDFSIKSQEIFIKNVLFEKNEHMSPHSEQRSFFMNNSNYLNENEENIVRPSVVSMNYNPSFVKKTQQMERKSFEEEFEEEKYGENGENGEKHENFKGNHQNFKENSHNYKRNNEDFDENNEIFHENNEISHENKEISRENHENNEIFLDKSPFEEKLLSSHSSQKNLGNSPSSHKNSRNSRNLQISENSHKVNELSEEFEKIKYLNHGLEKDLSRISEENAELKARSKDLENKALSQEAEILRLHQQLEAKELEILQIRGEFEEKNEEKYEENPPKRNFNEISSEKSRNFHEISSEKSRNFHEISAEKLANFNEISAEKPKNFNGISSEKPENFNENLREISSEEDSLESPYLLDDNDSIPSEKALIFPFKSNLEYFSSKTAKDYKGQLVVEDPELFREISLMNQDLKKFKLSCLKRKQLIHKGKDVQIGSLIRIQCHNNKDFLRIAIFLTNNSGKTLKNMDFELETQESLTIWSKTMNTSQELVAGGQRKLNVIIEYTNTPYKPLILKLKTQGEARNETTIFLPSTMNLFMKWENCEKFEEFWQKALLRKNLRFYKTRTRKFDGKIVRKFEDLVMFFPEMKEIQGKLEENNQKKEICGAFRLLNCRIGLLMKICVNLKKMTFVIRIVENGEEETSGKVKEFLLRTLMFLLGNDAKEKL